MDQRLINPKFSKRPQTSNLLNSTNPSIFQIKQFFDQIQKIKLISKATFVKPPTQLQTNRLQSIERKRITVMNNNRIVYRKGTRPLSHLRGKNQNSYHSDKTNQNLFSFSSSKNQTFIVNPENDRSVSKDNSYYKRFLMPYEKRIKMQSSDIYFTIQKATINSTETPQKCRAKSNKRTESINSKGSMRRYSKEIKEDYFNGLKRCDSPWSSHRRSQTGDF